MRPESTILQLKGIGGNSDHRGEMIQQDSTAIHTQEKRPNDPTEKKYITTEITVGIMDTIKATRTRQIYARGKMLDTIMSLHEATQWGYHRTTRHAYGRKY